MCGGVPVWSASGEAAQGRLAAEGVATDIQEVLVTAERMASELRFRGSPSIRINGQEIAGESQKARTFALSCRLYPASKQIGVPLAEMIHRQVLAAGEGDRR